MEKLYFYKNMLHININNAATQNVSYQTVEQNEKGLKQIVAPERTKKKKKRAFLLLLSLDSLYKFVPAT